MSLSAVLTAQTKIDWSTTKFNNVLLQGDKMYLKDLNNAWPNCFRPGCRIFVCR
jgi:hypothetical protein